MLRRVDFLVNPDGRAQENQATRWLRFLCVIGRTKEGHMMPIKVDKTTHLYGTLCSACAKTATCYMVLRRIMSHGECLCYACDACAVIFRDMLPLFGPCGWQSESSIWLKKVKCMTRLIYVVLVLQLTHCEPTGDKLVKSQQCDWCMRNERGVCFVHKAVIDGQRHFAHICFGCIHLCKRTVVNFDAKQAKQMLYSSWCVDQLGLPKDVFCNISHLMLRATARNEALIDQVWRFCD